MPDPSANPNPPQGDGGANTPRKRGKKRWSKKRGKRKPMPKDNGPHPLRRVQFGPIPTFAYRPPPGGPRVIHEEERFVVVDKPPGLLAVPGIAPEKHDCVRSRVAQMFPDAIGPMTCHRLDLSTSGVMILALDADIHRNLSKQFEFRKTQKRYLALVEGHLESDGGTITLPIRKDIEVRPLMLADHVEGLASETRWRVLSRETLGGRDVTRIEMEPHTGRTHQLRAHAAHPRLTTVGEMPGVDDDLPVGLGAPIVGDELYGGLPADRLMLHASMLTIHHPVTGKRMTFKAWDPF